MACSRFLLSLTVIGALLAAPGALSPERSKIAETKIERIQNEELRPGETVILSEDELNSYIRYDYADRIPPGVRDLRVSFRQDTGVADAWIDISKLGVSSGTTPGVLWTALLGGERKLHAVCRYVSSGGQATVDVESAQIDGREIPGPLLAWLIETTIQEEIEGFELGKPHPLPGNLREINLKPGQAIVTAK